MLPSLGFNEMIILAVLALLVVGPKDLPLLFRKIGRWTAKLRGMAQEFRTGFDELARQAELDELKREVDALRRTTNLQDIGRELSAPINEIKQEVSAAAYIPPPGTPAAPPPVVAPPEAPALEAPEASVLPAGEAAPHAPEQDIAHDEPMVRSAP